MDLSIHFHFFLSLLESIITKFLVDNLDVYLSKKEMKNRKRNKIKVGECKNSWEIDEMWLCPWMSSHNCAHPGRRFRPPYLVRKHRKWKQYSDRKFFQWIPTNFLCFPVGNDRKCAGSCRTYFSWAVATMMVVVDIDCVLNAVITLSHKKFKHLSLTFASIFQLFIQ
jgi:hypothetical protein